MRRLHAALELDPATRSICSASNLSLECSSHGLLPAETGKYTHSVYWPIKGQPGYVKKPDGKRERIAIVMRCVQTEDWYATELPGRKLADS